MNYAVGLCRSGLLNQVGQTLPDATVRVAKLKHNTKMVQSGLDPKFYLMARIPQLLRQLFALNVKGGRVMLGHHNHPAWPGQMVRRQR